MGVPRAQAGIADWVASYKGLIDVYKVVCNYLSTACKLTYGRPFHPHYTSAMPVSSSFSRMSIRVDSHEYYS